MLFSAIYDKYHYTDTPGEWLEQAEKGTYPEIRYVGLYQPAAFSPPPGSVASPVAKQLEDALQLFMAPPSYLPEEEDDVLSTKHNPKPMDTSGGTKEVKK